METQEKIKKLEREVATLWQIIDDERLWDPTVIREIKNRSKIAKKKRANSLLKTAKEVFSVR